MRSIDSQRLARPAAMLLVALLAVCLLALPAEACPTCSQALADNAGGGDMVSGYFWSILFMMSMPFLILAFFGLYFYWLIRKARLANEAAKP